MEQPTVFGEENAQNIAAARAYQQSGEGRGGIHEAPEIGQAFAIVGTDGESLYP